MSLIIKKLVIQPNFNQFIYLLLITCLFGGVVYSSSVFALNIDLSTLPSRDSVQLTIYNSENLTLVRETRQISIKKGQNQLQFSWANTQIDPTSVQIDFISHPADILLSHTTFPHSKPQMLYWHINSSLDMLATVEISYFTSGITWQADYIAILEHSKKTMALDSFVTIHNHSGENYDNAQVRLVIGKINLVDQISTLVQQAGHRKDQLAQRQKVMRRMAKKSKRDIMGYAPLLSDSIMAEMAEMAEEKTMAKDSLGDYYIFTIEGTETIPDQWAKRLRSGFAEQIMVDTVYRYRPREYGELLSRILIVRNDKKSLLGEAPLPAGNIQIYQKNKQGSLTYVAGLALKYTSIGDNIELNTGVDPDIYFKRVNIKNWRDNIWMHYRRGNVHRRVDKAQVVVDHNSTVSGWNEHRVYMQHIHNFTSQPIRVEIRQIIVGDASIRSHLAIKKQNYQTVDIVATLEVADKQALYYEIITKKGRNAKQNQVTIDKL
jgi:hypothetical protein